MDSDLRGVYETDIQQFFSNLHDANVKKQSYIKLIM